MQCSRCGALVNVYAPVCSSCGTPVSAGGTTSSLKRPGIITVLAVLNFIGAFLFLLLAGLTLASIETGSPEQFQAPLGAVFVLVGALYLACGIGLWQLKSYGRTLQLVFAWIGLLGLPVGTIISILILIYLYKPGIKVLFSGKSASQLTPVEQAQVADVSGGGLTVVIVILVGIVGSVIVVGILAAIAIPSLLRARTSANEASAIGALRTINSAQAAFAATCGNGFFSPTLAGLAIPPKGKQEAFIGAELAVDPLVNQGYTIEITPGNRVRNMPAACNGVPVVASYFASAAPETVGTTGTRFFATNQEATVYQSTSPIPVKLVGAMEGAPVQ